MFEKLKERLYHIHTAAENLAASALIHKVPEEIHDHRYSFCISCENLHKFTDRCSLCGCFMRVKTWMPNEECPIGKWSTFKIDKE